MHIETMNRNELAQYKKQVAAAKKELAAIKVTLQMDGCGEFRVNLYRGTEATAYYTDDLQDDIATGRAMREPVKYTLVVPTVEPAKKVDIRLKNYKWVLDCFIKQKIESEKLLAEEISKHEQRCTVYRKSIKNAEFEIEMYERAINKTVTNSRDFYIVGSKLFIHSKVIVYRFELSEEALRSQSIRFALKEVFNKINAKINDPDVNYSECRREACREIKRVISAHLATLDSELGADNDQLG